MALGGERGTWGFERANRTVIRHEKERQITGKKKQREKWGGRGERKIKT